jgi:hypothetical protein
MRSMLDLLVGLGRALNKDLWIFQTRLLWTILPAEHLFRSREFDATIGRSGPLVHAYRMPATLAIAIGALFG